MKFLSLFFFTITFSVTFVFAGSAYAEIDKSKVDAAVAKSFKSKLTIVAPAKKSTVRWRLLFGYSTASTLNSEGNLTASSTPVSFDFSAIESADSAAKLGAEIFIGSRLFEFAVGGTYEFSRKVNAASITASGTTAQINFAGANPTFEVFALHGNVYLKTDRAVRPFAGLNYSFLSHSDPTEVFNSRLGFQAGASLKLSNRWEIDLTYKVLNTNRKQADIDDIGNGPETLTTSLDSALSGVSLNARYTIQ